MRLLRFDHFAEVARRGGDQAHQESKEVKVMARMSLSGVLIRGDQRRRPQQDARLVTDFCDLVTTADEKGFDLTAMPGQGNIVTIRLGKRRRAFDLEGNALLGEVSPERQLHNCPGDHAAKMIVRRVPHSLKAMRQSMQRVGNPAFRQVAGVGEREEVGGSEHGVQ
jgi:hypothetical protein